MDSQNFVFEGVLCEIGKMGYEIRYVENTKVAQSVPTLGDYIAATIQDRDLKL